VYAFTGGRRDVTDDAVTEAFARAIRYDATIRDPVPWLYRTAFRLAARELRRERGVPPPIEVRETALDSNIELLDVLNRLPPSQRATLFLHYFADLPVSEIARRQGVTAAAVKVRLMRGRRALRDLLLDEVPRER
jgi:RNA polymerase sigma-70 factor (ECF subfamily)